MKERARVVCLIQARINSARLPGKVNMLLAEKHMVDNIRERCERAGMVDEVRVIWPGDAPNRDENDLIGRHLDVARRMWARLIVRVPGDNPCVEPAEIDRAIRLKLEIGTPCLVSNAGDYVYSNYPDGIGCEVYDIVGLEIMDREIKDSELREHPHKFWHDRKMVVEPMPPAVFHDRQDIRLDVNTQEDYDFIKSIYNHFGHNRFHASEVIKLIDENMVQRKISA